MKKLVIVDVDYVREFMTARNQQMDYERLYKVYDGYERVAIIGQDYGVEVKKLDNFKTRLAALGWNVVSYRYNRRLNDTPRPAALMAPIIHTMTKEGVREVEIFTGDRGIVPLFELGGTWFKLVVKFKFICPHPWTGDPLMFMHGIKTQAFPNFIEENPAVLAGGDWNVEDEFKVQ